MTHYIDADLLRAEIDKRYAEYRAKMKTDDFTYYEGMADALDLFEQYIDTFPEQPEADLEKELEQWRHEHFAGERDGHYNGEYLERSSQLDLARHFYELGLNARMEDK